MRRTNPYAIASFVAGLLWLFWLGSLAAVVLGHLARRQLARSGGRGRRLATLGLVLGYAGLLVLLFALFQGGTWVAEDIN